VVTAAIVGQVMEGQIMVGHLIGVANKAGGSRRITQYHTGAAPAATLFSQLQAPNDHKLICRPHFAIRRLICSSTMACILLPVAQGCKAAPSDAWHFQASGKEKNSVTTGEFSTGELSIATVTGGWQEVGITVDETFAPVGRYGPQGPAIMYTCSHHVHL
jgi:hypothetical protein